jgi:hypothetical protein
MLNYEKDSKIDPDALDVEWLQQTELGRKYAKHSALMKKKTKEVKETLEVLEAEMTRKIMRNSMKLTGKENPAKHDIEAYIKTQPEYRKLRQEVIDAEYESDYADMVQKEISIGRKAALGDLVTLFINQYFAGPTVSHDLAEMWRKRQRRDRSDDVVSVGKMKRK